MPNKALGRTVDRLVAITVASLTALGVAAAETSSPAPSTTFELSVVVTDRGKSILDTWDYRTGQRFEISPTKVAPWGKFLSALLLFKGCRPDKRGNCNADVDIIAYDPKGNVCAKLLGVELWQQKPAPDSGVTQLGRSYMNLVIEPTDPSGTYRIVAVARDKNGKTETKAETQVQVGM